MADGSDRRRLYKNSRIQLDDHSAIEYWSRKWGIAGAQIREAVVKVGPMADDVAAELGDALFYSNSASSSRSNE